MFTTKNMQNKQHNTFESMDKFKWQITIKIQNYYDPIKPTT